MDVLGRRVNLHFPKKIQSRVLSFHRENEEANREENINDGDMKRLAVLIKSAKKLKKLEINCARSELEKKSSLLFLFLELSSPLESKLLRKMAFKGPFIRGQNPQSASFLQRKPCSNMSNRSEEITRKGLNTLIESIKALGCLKSLNLNLKE